MKKVLFIFTFISLLFISCKKNIVVHDAQRHAIIDIPSISFRSISDRDLVMIAEFADSVSHIRLETTDESLIGRVSQILFLDSLLIIQDRQTHSVLFFDKGGTFINKINRRGSGPGEYVSMTRVMLNPDSRQIMVFDGTSRKMVFYNFDGTFIKEITQFADGAIIRDIINLPNGNFLCYNYDQNLAHTHSGLWEVDSNGVYVRTLLPPNTGYPFIANLHQSYLFHLSNGVGLAAGDVNVIYHFRQDTLTAFLSYSIRNRTSVEDIRNRTQHRNRYRRETSEFVRKSMSYEKGNYIFTEWSGDGGIMLISVYSKRDDNIVAIGLPVFQSSHLATFTGSFVPSNDVNSLVTITNGDDVARYLSSPSTSEMVRSKLTELTHGMSERDIDDMNPIIQILHIRQ